MKKQLALTVKEALEQGYTRYGFSNREWQHTQDLHEDVFNEVDEEDWEDLVLFEKDSRQTIVSEDEVKEILSEHVAVKSNEECARDDDRVYDAIKKISFQDTTDEINKALREFKYWMLTDIKLIPNNQQ